MRNTFLERIKSPVVLSGIVGALVQIALIWGINPEQVEAWRMTLIILIGIYEVLFVATNNPSDPKHY